MKTLRECLQDAEEGKYAIGHFNISDLAALKGIVAAAEELQVPVIIGLSEGEGAFFGLKNAKAIIESVRIEATVPVFLNADHSYSFNRFREAVDARFDSAIFDGAKLPFEENIADTKKCVSYAHSVDPDMLAEAELGYIGTSSKPLEELPAGVGPENLTSVEDAVRFVKETGVDLFAPAVGNVHGMLTHAPEPRLDIERIRAIREAVGIPLVLHGASGNSAEDIRAAIAAGVGIVHINTELRLAWRKSLEKALSDAPAEVAPYKLLAPVVEGEKALALEKLRIFSGR